VEHALFSIPWHELLFPKPSWLEKIVRPLLVYTILLVIFRLASKRELAQATLFDFLIILLISNVVQNAMIGDDNSVLGAAAGAVTLVWLSGRLNAITARSKKARTLLEGVPVLLIRNGVIDDQRMKQESISRNDLLMAIRKQGLTRLADVSFAILELDGTISVIKADNDRRPHDCLPPEAVGSESNEEAGPAPEHPNA
jgi:uncharacterized membrane protein YcaP (DUF421 family)